MMPPPDSEPKAPPLALPARFDLATVHEAVAALSARAGADLVLDAGDVGHLGGLGLQVLLSAAQSWRASGHSLRITPRSPAFDAALAAFGVPPSDLETGDAACP